MEGWCWESRGDWVFQGVGVEWLGLRGSGFDIGGELNGIIRSVIWIFYVKVGK